jgi:hypothetical protein
LYPLQAAWLGFYRSCPSVKLNNAALVEMGNHFASLLGCPEPPELDAQTVGKMGLKVRQIVFVTLCCEGGLPEMRWLRVVEQGPTWRKTDPEKKEADRRGKGEGQAVMVPARYQHSASM